MTVALDLATPLNREVLDEIRRAGGFASDQEALFYACWMAGDFILGTQMPAEAFELPYRPEMSRLLAAARRQRDGDDDADAQTPLFEVMS